MGENEFNENKLLIKKLNSEKENDQVTVSKENLVNEIKTYLKSLNQKGLRILN